MARETRMRFFCERFGKPSGNNCDLKGTGPGKSLPLSSLNFIHLAKLQVPQGGAMNTPITKGDSNHSRKRSWPTFVDRSATFMVLTALLLIWSTPNESLRPMAFKHAVTLAVPQNISMTTGWLMLSKLECSSIGLLASLELLPCEGKWSPRDENSGWKNGCAFSERMSQAGTGFGCSVASSKLLCGIEGAWLWRKWDSFEASIFSSWLMVTTLFFLEGCESRWLWNLVPTLLSVLLFLSGFALEVLLPTDSKPSQWFSWFWIEWGPKHLAQTCNPRRHLAPSAASLHPLILNA